MSNESKNKVIYDKLSAEQEEYKKWLLTQPPEEILNKSFEYSVRQDILSAIKFADFSDTQREALNCVTLKDIYNDLLDRENYSFDLKLAQDELIEYADELSEDMEFDADGDLITFVLVETNQEPVIEKAFDVNDYFKNAVGGMRSEFYLKEDSVAIIFDNAAADRNIPNRAFRDKDGRVSDVISGTFMIVGFDGKDYVSLTREQIDRYSERFKIPDIIMRYNGELLAVPSNEHSMIPLYDKSFEYAQIHDEITTYRASLRANVMCKTAIETAIGENYSDNRLKADGAKTVIDMYGLDRVKYVLANTVRKKDWDARISPENKAWAKTIPPFEEDGITEKTLVVDRVNSGLTDIFIRQVLKIEKELLVQKSSVLNKLESAKDAKPSASVPKKKEQVI